MPKKVLVFAAHPDDELLGSGGTAHKRARAGDEVYCAIAATGISSRHSSQTEGQAEIARLEATSRNATSLLGYKQVFFLGLPDNRMDSLDLLDVVKKLEAIITQVQPEVIYTHFHNDLNIDHRICFQAVMTAARPGVFPFLRQIYAFETLSSTEWQAPQEQGFRPNVFVELSELDLAQKIKAMEAYKTELREYPHPRSAEGIRVLAQYRGMQAGFRYAEAFELVRDLNPNH